MARKKKRLEPVDRCCNDRCDRFKSCALFNCPPPKNDRTRIRYIKVINPADCSRFVQWTPGKPFPGEGQA